MRRPPRSVVAWSLAGVVAVATAIVVFGDLSTLHRRADELGEPRSVLVAVRDLPLGATVGTQDVQRVRRYASTVPEDSVSAMDAAVGRTVAVPVLEGALLLAPHLTEPDRDGTGGLVAPGSRAVRVRPADGLRPAAGAVVDVLAALDPSVVSGPSVPGGEATVVARAARVLAVDTGVDATATDDTAGVTLLVTEDEARELAFASANGVVTLAIAPPEDACC